MGTVCLAIRVLRVKCFGDARNEVPQEQLQGVGVEDLRAIRIGPDLFCKRCVFGLINDIVVVPVTHAAVLFVELLTTFDSRHVDVKRVSGSR